MTSAAATGTAEKDPQFAYTLARGLDVLRAFDGSVAELGNREIAQRIGIARSTVARLTRTLAMLGYLQYDAARARYRMGAALLTLAYPLLAQLPIRQIARPLLQKMANIAHGSVSLAMNQGAHMVLIESCVGPDAVTRPDIGATRDLVSTSLGFAYLAGLEGPKRSALLNQVLPSAVVADAMPRSTVLARIKQEVGRYQKSGFCVAQHGPGSTLAVAVHVRGPNGELMAVNCAVALHLADARRMELEIGPRLVGLARDLENLLGTAA